MKPLMFSTPMVRALKAGEKSQTRRVVPAEIDDEQDRLRYAIKRFGNVGDRIWVKETWRPKHTGKKPSIDVKYDDPIEYRADFPDDYKQPRGASWGSVMYMAKSSSRFILTITELLIQRLQDITEDDAKAEGAKCIWEVPLGAADSFVQLGAALNGQVPGSYRRGYRDAWDKINDRPGHTWDDNPFVVAVSFSVASRRYGDPL